LSGRRAVDVAEFRAPDLLATVLLDFLSGNSVIDDHRVVVATNVHALTAGHLDVAIANETLGLIARQSMMIKVVITETVPGRRIPGRCADAKPDTDGRAAIDPRETHVGAPSAFRRQRSPAAVARGAAPSDPGRSPVITRIPYPTEAGMLMPAAIMVRSPAPSVGRVPIPTRIGPQPRSTVAVGLPCRVCHRGRRAPAPSVARDFHPTAIGGE